MLPAEIDTDSYAEEEYQNDRFFHGTLSSARFGAFYINQVDGARAKFVGILQ
jgi:hypothetical protein